MNMEVVNLETVENIIFKQTVYRSEEHFEDWLHPDKPYEFRCPDCHTSSVMLNRSHDSKRQWEVKNKIDLISLNQNGGFDENKVNEYHYSYPEYFFASACSNCNKSYFIVL